MKVEFYKHNLDNKDKNSLKKILDSYFLTTGNEVKKFEDIFSKYKNSKYCVGVSSCTEALFLTLKGLGISTNDEVITTPLSFIASSNAIEYCGAKPIFVDVEESTGNINANFIEEKINKNTKAILIVHMYGQMCDVKKISKIAKKYKLKLIEDCAHCIEGERDGISSGELSDAACFSFYATKNITSGEGGAITTNNKDLYDWLIMARSHGMSKNAIDRYQKKYEHYDMEILGYKSNMTNIEASLLINQISRINKFLKIKEKIAKKYNTAFMKNPKIKILIPLEKSKHARHLYTIQVDPKMRDKIIKSLQDKNIGVAVNFRPIHLMKYYKNKYGYEKNDYPIAEKIGNSTITLPFYPKLTKKEIDYVIKSVLESIS